MIILNKTTDKLQVKLGGTVVTNQVRCYASFRDVTSFGITPNINALNTNNTTPVDLVESPVSSTQRVIDFINIFNADVGQLAVTLIFNDDSTTYNLLVATLGVSERLEYQEGNGFSIYKSDGSKKENVYSSSATFENTINVVTTNNETITTNTSFVDITDLNFPVIAGVTYWFRFVIPYITTITTNGSRFSVNGPSSPTFLIYQSEVSLTTTTLQINRGLTTYDSPAAASANSASTTSNIAIIEGIITPSANGTLSGRVASETAAPNSITVKPYSVLFYQKINA